MLDVGEQIEPERIALRDRMAAVEPDGWDPLDIEMARAPSLSGGGEGILPYGSDVLFRDPVGFADSNDGAPTLGFKPSFAKGGMSNGWGASVLPYRAEDLRGWPIGERELAPHYNAIKNFVPIAAQNDNLAKLFPMLAIAEDTALPISTQAATLLNRLGKRQAQLEAMGVFYGRARQAVVNECRACGMCLFGCPYRLIYNAASVVENLSKTNEVDYQQGQYVLRFEENGDRVRLWSRDLADGKVVVHEAKRIFITAGVISTARIVLNSLGKVDEPVLMDDSQHFFLPMVHRWWPRPDPAKEARHTLTQLFVEILDPEVSANTVHFQLYTHNEFYAADMRQRFGPFAGLMRPAIAHLSRRLIVGQGFLHSQDSAKIEIRLAEAGDYPRLKIKAVANEATGPAVDRAIRRMGNVASKVGLVPLAPLRRIGSIGSSYHWGGTFPMRDHPGAMETDSIGRLPGLRRVFLADSSVFPSVPATTISFSIMANAHRIATAARNAD